MSRQFRHRVTAVVLGGLLFGAPLLANGTANADQIDSGGRQVVFGGGGLLDFSCRSQPDAGAMTVPAQGTVTVVNRTGRNARLLLGGREQGVLPDDGSTEVVFRRGTTAVALDPDCRLGGRAAPAMITVAPSPPGLPSPIPVPGTGTPSAAPSSVNPSSTSAPTGVPSSGSASPSVSHRPPRTSAPATGVGPPRVRGPRPGHGSPRDAGPGPKAGTPLRINPRTSRRTTRAAAPLPSETPNEEPGVPLIDLATAPPAAPAAPTTEAAAAEPVAAMRPLAPERPIGLLALVATVCALGVGAAAIRSFAAQRAYRSTIA